jgi:HEAT repeat protein
VSDERGAVQRMEACFTDPGALRAGFSDPDWTVRLAAATAAGQRRDPALMDLLIALLDAEGAEPLYTQPPAQLASGGDSTEIAERIDPVEVTFPSLAEAPGAATLDAWRRRGRIKQAVLFAVAAIGSAPASFVRRVERCLADKAEDYPVRMAAARCLGAIGDERSRAALQAGAAVDEWCTATESRKALEVIRGR